MIEWEYRKIDLNQHHPRGDELDLLNDAGADGWELVGITSNHIAYLKRPVEVPAPDSIEVTKGFASNEGAHENAEAREPTLGVRVKYRDPKTNETWSGRGRMANWLKKKQDAGEDIEEYLV